MDDLILRCSQAELSDSARRRQHRRARGQAIVDEDYGSAVNFNRTSASAVCPLAAFEFLLFALGDRIDPLVLDAGHV